MSTCSCPWSLQQAARRMGLLRGLCCVLAMPLRYSVAVMGNQPPEKALRVRRVAGRLAARIELADELRRLGDW